jgi:hypothetical protein
VKSEGPTYDGQPRARGRHATVLLLLLTAATSGAVVGSAPGNHTPRATGDLVETVAALRKRMQDAIDRTWRSAGTGELVRWRLVGSGPSAVIELVHVGDGLVHSAEQSLADQLGRDLRVSLSVHSIGLPAYLVWSGSVPPALWLATAVGSIKRSADLHEISICLSFPKGIRPGSKAASGRSLLLAAIAGRAMTQVQLGIGHRWQMLLQTTPCRPARRTDWHP